MQIQLLQLALLATRLVENYRDRGHDTVQIDDMDMYWVVRPPDWTALQHEPNLSVGSLRDDWVALQQVLERQMPTSVDFDRLATVLRALSECLAR